MVVGSSIRSSRALVLASEMEGMRDGGVLGGVGGIELSCESAPSRLPSRCNGGCGRTVDVEVREDEVVELVDGVHCLGIDSTLSVGWSCLSHPS